MTVSERPRHVTELTGLWTQILCNDTFKIPVKLVMVKGKCNVKVALKKINFGSIPRYVITSVV
jgi:hypothetical protein